MYRDLGTAFLIAIVVAAISASVADRYFESKGKDFIDDDNPIVEVVEDIIEGLTGVDIDIDGDGK